MAQLTGVRCLSAASLEVFAAYHSQKRRRKEEEEEEEGLFKADAVNEEDPERDRATQV